MTVHEEMLHNLDAMKELYEQVKWERDVAISQLEDIGCGLGRKMDDIKEAKEKQIPKKPIEKEIVFEDEDVGTICVCPVCVGEIGLFEGQPYCEFCGQKIDWEEGGTSD